MAWYRNFYECPCGTTWHDEWDCTGDDRCPDCRTSCSPSSSVELDEDTGGVIQATGQASWGQERQSMALGEGWGVFDFDSTGVLQVQRYDEAARFENDTAALRFVTERASAGSDLHRLALEIISK